MTITDGDRNKLNKVDLLKESNLEEGILINMEIPTDNLISTAGFMQPFCTGSSIGSKLEKDKRRVYLTLDIKTSAPDNLLYYKTRVDIKVYGQKKTLFGWNNYKTRFHAKDIRFSFYDNGLFYPLHNSGIKYESIVDEYEGGKSVTIGYGTLFSDYVRPSHFQGAMGRVSSRGTGGNYAVLCCGSILPFVECPSATD